MPELPDLTVYVEHLNERLVGSELAKVHLASAFLLRTVTPTLDELHGRKLVSCSRLAKQIVFELGPSCSLNKVRKNEPHCDCWLAAQTLML
ncbi:MAG: formamidopyrimidine-DNA glycosylase [Limisphaerales bacterium]|jgi:formamidopyrimidine-DNA glycosylase